MDERQREFRVRDIVNNALLAMAFTGVATLGVGCGPSAGEAEATQVARVTAAYNEGQADAVSGALVDALSTSVASQGQELATMRAERIEVAGAGTPVESATPAPTSTSTATETSRPIATPTSTATEMPRPTATSTATAAAEPAAAEEMSSTEELRSITALKYDEEGFTTDPNKNVKLAEGDSETLAELSEWLLTVQSGQTELAAWPVRRAQDVVLKSPDVTDEEAQQAMVEAIVSVQELADKAGVPSFEGKTLKLDFGKTYLVWCANAKGTDLVVPADASKPYGDNHQGFGDLWIWAPSAHYNNAPDPSRTTFESCEGAEFWAVPLK